MHEISSGNLRGNAAPVFDHNKRNDRVFKSSVGVSLAGLVLLVGCGIAAAVVRSKSVPAAIVLGSVSVGSGVIAVSSFLFARHVEKVNTPKKVSHNMYTTELISAIEKDNTFAVRWYLMLGANPNQVKHGQSERPLSYVRNHDGNAMYNLLRSYGAVSN